MSFLEKVKVGIEKGLEEESIRRASSGAETPAK